MPMGTVGWKEAQVRSVNSRDVGEVSGEEDQSEDLAIVTVTFISMNKYEQV